MSVTLTTPISSLCFLSELDRVELSVSGEQSVEVAISKDSETEIFRNIYVPDDDGRIIIYDLDKVVEPYLTLGNLRSNRFTLAIGDEAGQFIVIPCSTAAVSESASTFAPDFFLTPAMAERDTCLGRYETVTALVEAGTEYSVLAQYFNGSSVVEHRYDGTTTVDCEPIDVSPNKYESAGLGSLISYIVICGNRKARYRVMRTLPDADPAIIFLNSFGCWETLYLTGTKACKSKFTRSSAIIDGQFRIYDIKEEALMEAHTGPLRPSMVAVATDLARSKSVFLLKSNGSVGDEIAITDADTSYVNDDNAMPDLKFTFRRANNRSALIHAIRPPRIFDHHFDEHFE